VNFSVIRSSSYLPHFNMDAPVVRNKLRSGRNPRTDGFPFNPDNITATEAERGRSQRRWPTALIRKLADAFRNPDWLTYLISVPGYGDDAKSEWTPLWPVGEGGQGKAAVWAKHDQFGGTEDQ
jgi:hypothetical protein